MWARTPTPSTCILTRRLYSSDGASCSERGPAVWPGRALPFSPSAEMGERRAVLHSPPSSQSLLGQQKQAGGSKHGLNFSKTKPVRQKQTLRLGKEDPKSVLLLFSNLGTGKQIVFFPPLF